MRRLRQKESNLDAENQILKSKLLQAGGNAEDPLKKTMPAPVKPLSGPVSSSRTLTKNSESLVEPQLEK